MAEMSFILCPLPSNKYRTQSPTDTRQAIMEGTTTVQYKFPTT